MIKMCTTPEILDKIKKKSATKNTHFYHIQLWTSFEVDIQICQPERDWFPKGTKPVKSWQILMSIPQMRALNVYYLSAVTKRILYETTHFQRR